jgi:pimeloyl-ACP methyl ester carboxylesterase
LLQPSTGHDIISDVRDLFVWLSGPTAELNDEIVCNPGRLRIGNPPKIGVVGTSGGGVPGYLAALYAEPKPVVFLAMYCMTGNFYVCIDLRPFPDIPLISMTLQTPRYILPKTEVFFQGKPLLDVDADERLIPYLSIPTPIPGISDSPLVYNKDGTSANIRTLLTRLFLQQALYLDVLTGHAGLSASLSLSVLDRVPSENDFTTEQKKLIPMFNFTRDFPPTCLVHGTGDTAILFEESDAVATRLADLGVESEFVKVPGADHLFDLFEGVEKYKEYTDRAFGFLRKYLD